MLFFNVHDTRGGMYKKLVHFMFWVLVVNAKLYKFHLGTQVVNVVVIIISCLCNLVGVYKYKTMFYSMGVALVPIFGMLIHSITEYDAANHNGACWPRTLLSGID